MLHVKYKLDKSNHHGIALFADQIIAKDDLVYTASPILDLNINQEQLDSLDESEKQEVLWWGFFDKPSQMWHVDFDVSKFINHSCRSRKPDKMVCIWILNRMPSLAASWRG